MFFIKSPIIVEISLVLYNGYTNRKVTMVAGVSFRDVRNGSKARMLKKNTKLSPQSTAHVPFFASPNDFSVLVTQAHLENEKKP